jgi:hypothetical protein
MLGTNLDVPKKEANFKLSTPSGLITPFKELRK